MNKIEKLIKLFKSCDKVTFTVTGCGEETFKTIEFKNAIAALEKQIELNDYLNTLRKNKKYQIYDILSEFALEVENE